MKLSSKTLNILKNFSTINSGIIIEEGKTLSTISTSKTIFASAKVEEEFDTPFAIFDLSRFLGTLSLFKDPDITFGGNSLTISEGNKKINYVYADPSVIVAPPKKELKLPSEDVSFTLTPQSLADSLKAISVLGLPELAIVGENGKVKIQGVDSKLPNGTGDVFSEDVGETDKEFRAIFKVENLKLIPGKYNVTVAEKGLAKFEGEEASYFVAVEKNSTF